ncbi:MAG: rod shape-determining protein MreD [Clostridiaceae bacterium]|jgi:rod shape-determining protein MreD|nr:rod shape-determining protein MreD [Clostridiaceae bacterium]
MPGISRPVNIWRRVSLYAVLLFVLAVVQVYPGQWLRLPAPDFLLLLPLVIGLTRGGREGFTMGLIAGFLRDYLSGRLYGLGMLEGMLIGLLAAMFFSENTKIFWRRLLLLCLGVTLAHVLVMSFLSYLFPFSSDLPLSLAKILMEALAGLPLVLLVNLFASVLILLFLWLGFYQKKKKQKKTGVESYGGYGRAL